MMKMTYPGNQRERSRPLAILIIPPAQRKLKQTVSSKQEHVALEAMIQSLVLDKRHPVALELAGTADRRSFIVRATSQTALDHVEALLRSQYPQIDVRPLEEWEDPFRLEPHEAISAVELFAGGASYLPLRTWQENGQEQEETDPVLGLLASLSKLPEETRAITQIALVPAPINWSHKSLRKTVEHPLEAERQLDLQRRKAYGDTYSPQVVLSMGILLILVLLLRVLLPAWISNALLSMVIGQNPHLNHLQVVLLIGLAFGLIVAGLLVFLIFAKLRAIFNPTPIYDMRMVARTTSRIAYRTRLRLYVIGSVQQKDLAAQNDDPKYSPPGFWDRLRLEREQAEARQNVLLRLIAAYRQYNQASGSYFIPKKISPKKASRLLKQQKARQRWARWLNFSRNLITADALAALWHLPAPSMLSEMGLVEHRRARTLLMPPDVARQSRGLSPVGYSEHGGYRLPFALTPQFFTMHTLIAGKSGEGKSTCMEHVAGEAMKQGGLILIDPHGDLCDHVLNLVPAERADDVVLIDLSDTTAVVGINPLDVTLGRGRDKAVSDLLKTLAHVWVSSWGPRMENAFEMSLRTLFEANKVLVTQDIQNGPGEQYTLLDVLPLLTNENFCHALLSQIEDDYLHRWWREYYEPLTLMQQRDVVNPVITKVAKFESVLARRILGQNAATLNFTQMIAERKIILFKLAKGVVGADVAALIGATMLGLLQLTLEEQGARSEQERARFPIILDEFQLLAGIDYGGLAELRKYGATFFLATQSLEYLQKLDELLLPTVLANVRQLVIFNLSARDAETLHQELGVEPEDILNLDVHTCYVKLPAGERRQPTFSLRLEPPQAGDSTLAESIRARCRVRYTCSVEEVDRKLREAMIRSIRLTPTPRGKARPASSPAPSGQKEAPVADGSPILLPASSVNPADPTASSSDGSRSEPRKRKNRGRRGRGREAKAKAGAVPATFSEDFSEEEVEEYEEE